MVSLPIQIKPAQTDDRFGKPAMIAQTDERFGGLKPFEFHHLPDEMRDNYIQNGYMPASGQDSEPPYIASN